MEILKVSAQSVPKSVAGAISGIVKERGSVEVQAIGAGAVNQAVKAAAISGGFLASAGIEMVCIPEFCVVEAGGEERTAIKLTCQQR